MTTDRPTLCEHCRFPGMAARATFCEQCGQPLLRTCPQVWGAPVSFGLGSASNAGRPRTRPDARPAAWHRPSHTLRATWPSEFSPRARRSKGERKQVTVLFADIRSSLELLADQDPGGGPEAPRRGDPAHDGRGPSLRGNGESGDWATASWPCSARRWHMRTMPCAPAMPRLRMQEASVRRFAENCGATRGRLHPDPRRPQFRRGRGALDQQRSAHGLQRDRVDHSSRRAHATACDPGTILADRRHVPPRRRPRSRSRRSGRSP